MRDQNNGPLTLHQTCVFVRRQAFNYLWDTELYVLFCLRLCLEFKAQLTVGARTMPLNSLWKGALEAIDGVSAPQTAARWGLEAHLRYALAHPKAVRGVCFYICHSFRIFEGPKATLGPQSEAYAIASYVSCLLGKAPIKRYQRSYVRNWILNIDYVS